MYVDIATEFGAVSWVDALGFLLTQIVTLCPYVFYVKHFIPFSFVGQRLDLKKRHLSEYG